MIEQSSTSSFIHKFVAGKGSPFTLLLLHGTGGNEEDLIPIGRTIGPGASLLGVRGQVLEKGMPRFFHRFSEGVFDTEDLIGRAHQLADFLKFASGIHGFDVSKIIPVGFSNGANIAAGMLLLRPEHTPAAVLFRPMVPLEPEDLPDLSSTHIYIGTGNMDPIVSAENTQELSSLFRTAGAHVTLRVENAGHALASQDIEHAGEWLQERLKA